MDQNKKIAMRILWYVIFNLIILSALFINGLVFMGNAGITLEFGLIALLLFRTVGYIIVINLFVYYILKIKKIDIDNILKK